MREKIRRLFDGIALPGWVLLVWNLAGILSRAEYVAAKMHALWQFATSPAGQAVSLVGGVCWLTLVVTWPELGQRLRPAGHRKLAAEIAALPWAQWVALRLACERPGIHVADWSRALERLGFHEAASNIVDPLLNAGSLAERDFMGYVSLKLGVAQQVRRQRHALPAAPC